MGMTIDDFVFRCILILLTFLLMIVLAEMYNRFRYIIRFTKRYGFKKAWKRSKKYTDRL